MRCHDALFRFSAAVAVGGLLLGPALAPMARAQSDAGPNAGPYAGPNGGPNGGLNPGSEAGDPPARVGRLASMNGTVSFHGPGETEWSPATLNYPVTSGDAVWTQPSSTAVIEVGPAHIALSQTTEFDVDTLDDRNLSATTPQGEVYLRLADTGAGQSTEIHTPRGVVTITQPGRYEVAAGDTDHPTTVTVLQGAAQVQGAGAPVSVGPQQMAEITGTDNFQASVVPAVRDPFIDAQLAQERPLPANGAAPPPVVALMTGGDALMSTGSWAADPQYGEIWYPPAEAGYVPYRNGHWAYVSPWGWTWIDDAPWGFAPFHYGRWVQQGPRWGWIAAEPGYGISEQPYYAPALVAFVGLGVGVAIGASVGWIPLGPREAYYPPYRVSSAYLRGANARYVPNAANINFNNQRPVGAFANRAAATVVPASAMTSSRPVAPMARSVNAQEFASARSLPGTQLRPNTATAGVTPAVARQLNLAAPAPGTAPVRRVAPGPAVQSRVSDAVPLRAPGAAIARPGAASVAPPVPGGVPGGVREGVPGGVREGVPGGVTGGVPGAANGPRNAVAPGAIPPLRTPGERQVQGGGPQAPGSVQRPQGEAGANPALRPPGSPAGAFERQAPPGGAPNGAPGGAPGPAIAPRGPAPGGVNPALRPPGSPPGSFERQVPSGAVPGAAGAPRGPAPAGVNPALRPPGAVERQQGAAGAVPNAAAPALVRPPAAVQGPAVARPAAPVQREVVPTVQRPTPQAPPRAIEARPPPAARPAAPQPQAAPPPRPAPVAAPPPRPAPVAAPPPRPAPAAAPPPRPAPAAPRPAAPERKPEPK